MTTSVESTERYIVAGIGDNLLFREHTLALTHKQINKGALVGFACVPFVASLLQLECVLSIPSYSVVCVCVCGFYLII